MKLTVERFFDVGLPKEYPWRVFLSLLPYRDGYCGVLREFNPQVPIQQTALRRLLFDNAGTIYQDDKIGAGEDPRIFSFRGQLYCLTWTYPAKHEWHHWLINLETRERQRLRIEPHIFHGKNWVPLVVNDELCIIRSLDPLMILKADTETGACSIIAGSSSNYHYIGEYRGGSAARYHDGIFEGWGHRTRHREHHTLFHYRFKDRAMEFTDCEVEGLNEYGIIDPTSQFEDRLIVCATKGSWSEIRPTCHAMLIIQ
jgi:hypothetical protein